MGHLRFLTLFIANFWMKHKTKPFSLNKRNPVCFSRLLSLEGLIKILQSVFLGH